MPKNAYQQTLKSHVGDLLRLSETSASTCHLTYQLLCFLMMCSMQLPWLPRARSSTVVPTSKQVSTATTKFASTSTMHGITSNFCIIFFTCSIAISPTDAIRSECRCHETETHTSSSAALNRSNRASFTS